MNSKELDLLTNEIEQQFMQRGGWGQCRYLLGKHFSVTPMTDEEAAEFGRHFIAGEIVGDCSLDSLAKLGVKIRAYLASDTVQAEMKEETDGDV